MKPFSFQFKELPKKGESLDFSQIEYDATLNLSVNKETRRPAIDEIQMGTETFTRETGEATDSDYTGSVGMLMATETATKSGEGVDSDRDGRIGLTMETATTTMVSTEGTDSDK